MVEIFLFDFDWNAWKLDVHLYGRREIDVEIDGEALTLFFFFLEGIGVNRYLELVIQNAIGRQIALEGRVETMW